MRAVVFDFDGVIIPSEDIKKKGYELIFSEYGEAVPAQAIDESRAEFANAKGDRYDIIRGILLRVGVRGDIEQKVSEYAGRFNAIVGERINAFRVEEPVRRRLETLSESAALYINSNTPEAVLRDTLATLEILPMFKRVFGSSTPKEESLRAIAVIEGIDASRMVFIGDGEGDREAAESFGCGFIGVATASNGWNTAHHGHTVVASVAEITEELLPAVI